MVIENNPKELAAMKKFMKEQSRRIKTAGGVCFRVS